jgi:small-conductance mechanosensitive channel
MEFDLQSLTDRLTELARLGLESVSDAYVFFQAVVILVIYLISYFIARKSEPILEVQARKIRNSPGLLRVIISLLRRLRWVYFAILVGIAWSVLNNIEWPRTYLVYISLLLSMVWLLITAFSQTIRNRASRRFISVSVWFYVAIVLLGVNDDVSELLNAIGFSLLGFRISLLLLVKIFVVLSVALWGSISLGNFVDRRIQQNEEIAPGLRILIGKVIRVTLIVMAAIIAMSGLGVDLTVFSVLSGAIGVGIGFGLQKVVSNFISGLIILADRSIRPGDTISLGDTFGWIRELRARFVSVVTRDGREFLIPNEDFITREVINWSFSDELVRLEVDFGVSYDSDPDTVTAIAIEAALGVPRVVESQPPMCWMTSFGDSSIDFVLRFWIRDPQRGLTNIRGQILNSLWYAFKENEISIPYPHRELVFKDKSKLKGLED